MEDQTAEMRAVLSDQLSMAIARRHPMTQQSTESDDTLDESIVEHLSQAREHLRQALITAAQQDASHHVLRGIVSALENVDRILEPDLLRTVTKLQVLTQKLQERQEQPEED